jgi:hypothetical protein
LKRTIQREVETPISKVLLAGEAKAGTNILLDAKQGDVKLSISTVVDTSYTPSEERNGDSGSDNMDDFVDDMSEEDLNYMQ